MNAPTQTRLPSWINPIAYPFPLRRVAVCGGTLSTIDVGQGPAILLLHGTPVWSYAWRAVIDRLGTDVRVIAPDHLGFGLSDKTPGAETGLSAHSRRLGELLDALDVDEVIVVGHDVGGAIGLHWASQHPARVRGLVLLNTFVGFPGQGVGGALLRFLGTPVGRWLYQASGASPKWLLPSGFSDPSLLSPETHQAYLNPWPTARSRALMADVPRLLCGPELAELAPCLHSLREVPTEIVWGEADTILPPMNREALLRAFPQASLTRLAGVGHFAQEEDPQSVVEAIRRRVEQVR